MSPCLGEAENEEDSTGEDEMTNYKEEGKKTRVVYTRVRKDNSFNSNFTCVVIQMSETISVITTILLIQDVLNELRDSPASKLWPAFAEEDCVR